jgi:signal transduction histidine kinase
LSSLHRVLAQNRDEVLRRWASEVRKLQPDPAISGAALVDHVPKFLDELCGLLRAFEVLKAEGGDRSSTAADHGSQRFRLGFDLDAVVREYGTLHRCILDVAYQHGTGVTLDEQNILVQVINEGIADAVLQYTRQRDVELARQNNEHFAFVAHELRNPLGSVELAFSSLTEKGLLPDHPMVKVLGRGVRRAKDLIENTLSLMVTSQAIELRPRRLKVSDLIQDAVHESQPAALDKGISVVVDTQGDAEVEADERLIRSALTNLIGNAVKFTHPGRPVHVRWNGDAERLTIEIEDGCGGLPDGAAEKMFAPFVQVGDNRTGFGLGLAIARQALQAHGGTIRVRNRPGDGCTFIVELVLAPGPG